MKPLKFLIAAACFFSCGAIIGITDLFYLNQDRPAGLNFFIPIGDALDFLNLEPK